MKTFKRGVAAAIAAVGLSVSAGQAHAEIDLRSLLKEGILGAGVGAISAGVGKGNAGTGALVGAGTQIIGGSLLSFLTEPSGSGRTVYASQQQAYVAQPVYYSQAQPVYSQSVYAQPVPAQEPVYTYSQPAYSYAQPQTQDDSAKKVIKQGLLGAGVGALAAGVGDGNAGTGALVGAGTSVIGGALLDFLTGTPSTASTPQTVYYTAAPSSVRTTRTAPVTDAHRRIVRTYDAEGKLVKEEEFWD